MSDKSKARFVQRETGASYQTCLNAIRKWREAFKPDQGEALGDYMRRGEDEIIERFKEKK